MRRITTYLGHEDLTLNLTDHAAVFMELRVEQGFEVDVRITIELKDGYVTINGVARIRDITIARASQSAGAANDLYEALNAYLLDVRFDDVRRNLYQQITNAVKQIHMAYKQEEQDNGKQA